MLSTMLYTTYSVYHAKMGGAAVLDEILDKLSIDLFLPGEALYNKLAGSENPGASRSISGKTPSCHPYQVIYHVIYHVI